MYFFAVFTLHFVVEVLAQDPSAPESYFSSQDGSPPPQKPCILEALKDLKGGKSRTDTYPHWITIPETSFSCANVNQPGFYADEETDCQVIRRCDSDGLFTSILCPIQMLFNQITLVCDWWYNVNCSMSALYRDYSNSRLYHVGWPLFDQCDDYTEYQKTTTVEPTELETNYQTDVPTVSETKAGLESEYETTPQTEYGGESTIRKIDRTSTKPYSRRSSTLKMTLGTRTTSKSYDTTDQKIYSAATTLYPTTATLPHSTPESTKTVTKQTTTPKVLARTPPTTKVYRSTPKLQTHMRTSKTKYSTIAQTVSPTTRKMYPTTLGHKHLTTSKMHTTTPTTTQVYGDTTGDTPEYQETSTHKIFNLTSTVYPTIQGLHNSKPTTRKPVNYSTSKVLWYTRTRKASKASPIKTEQLYSIESTTPEELKTTPSTVTYESVTQDENTSVPTLNLYRSDEEVTDATTTETKKYAGYGDDSS